MGAAVTAVTWVAFVFLLSGPIGAAPHKNKADDGYGDYGPTLHRGSRGFTLAMHQTPTRYREQVAMHRALFTGAAEGRDSFSFGGGRNYNSREEDGGNCPEKKRCDHSKRYRTEDGSCNNLAKPSWGQSGLPYSRLIERQHSLVDCGRASHLPNARLVSQALIRRGEFDVSPEVGLMVMVYGQVIDHDMGLTPPRTTPRGDFLDCCEAINWRAPDCCPIFAPSSDHFYGRNGRSNCIPFLRSAVTKGIDCKAKSDVQNINTPLIDASYLYGSDKETADMLRQFHGGALRFKQYDGSPRMFPPQNASVEDQFRMEFGDSRSDVTPAFTMVYTALLRLHNHVAKRLSAMHPEWSDETAFQETKKIVVAIHQHIIYTQWLDVLLGTPNDVHVHAHKDGYENVYDPEVDPTVSIAFSTAAFRLHTLIPGWYSLRDEHYMESGRMRLSDVFHNARHLLANTSYDDLIRGLAAQPMHDFNNVFTTEMVDWLFKEHDEETGVEFGMDIVALNVQRGRDHQMPTYPAYRKFCGLKKPKTWTDLTDLISPEQVHRLFHTYASPSDVDLYIAQVMEKPVTGSLLGPTSHCIVRDQFERLKAGDRFFYTNHGVFTPAQLSAIKRVTLSRVLCDHADSPATMKLPRDMFRVADKKDNPPLSCRDTFNIPALDLEPWR